MILADRYSFPSVKNAARRLVSSLMSLNPVCNIPVTVDGGFIKKGGSLVSPHQKGFKRSGVVYFNEKTRTPRGQKVMVDAVGFEPTAAWLQTKRSSS